MCARPERDQYIPPIAELLTEFASYSDSGYAGSLREFAWAGIVVHNGLVENA